jgi:phytanoyl-CoA hydroxylase
MASLSSSNANDYTVDSSKIKFFQDNGFVVLEDVISLNEVERYVCILDAMLENKISTKDKRGDLGGHTKRIKSNVENTVQITHPDCLTSKLDHCEHFRKGIEIANTLYGGSESSQTESWGLDCSQFIVKFAKTETETPWHQDQSYYPDELVDKRACNIWLALEECTVESGCMRFIPTPLSSTLLSPHRAAGNGKGALTTDPPNGIDEQVYTPLRAGSVVVFNNYTYHFGGGNNSDVRRPAFVGQFRPKKMIQKCREIGFDHGKFTSNEDGAERTSRATKEK